MWAAPFQCTVLCPLWLSLASIGRIKGVAVLAVFDTVGCRGYWDANILVVDPETADLGE